MVTMVTQSPWPFGSTAIPLPLDYAPGPPSGVKMRQRPPRSRAGPITTDSLRRLVVLVPADAELSPHEARGRGGEESARGGLASRVQRCAQHHPIPARRDRPCKNNVEKLHNCHTIEYLDV